MQSISTRPLTEFLAQPNIEASPAWEFINGTARQKVMPTLYHSRLQRNLVNWINQNTDRYEAIQALRCVIPPISPVPDIVAIPQSGRFANEIGRLPQIDGPFEILIGAFFVSIDLKVRYQSENRRGYGLPLIGQFGGQKTGSSFEQMTLLVARNRPR